MKLRNVLVLNGINMGMLVLIIAIYFLLPPVVAIAFGVIWLVWVVLGNYKLIMRDHDVLREFRRTFETADRRHGTTLMPRYGTRLAQNHEAIMARYDFFLGQTDSIFSAYELIQKKSAKYLYSAMAYLEQYDFVRRPRPDHLQKLVENSGELVDKLNELCEDCFNIQDQASDVDVSVIDDLLRSLDQMQDDT